MPIYVYDCSECGARAEVLQKQKDLPPTCEACGKNTLVKALTTASSHFHGVGWASSGYDKVSMGKTGPLATDFQQEMTHVASEAAKTGGHKAGAKAVKAFQEKLK